MPAENIEEPTVNRQIASSEILSLYLRERRTPLLGPHTRGAKIQNTRNNLRRAFPRPDQRVDPGTDKRPANHSSRN